MKACGKFFKSLSRAAYSDEGWISGRKSTRDVRLDVADFSGCLVLPEFWNQTTQFSTHGASLYILISNGNPAHTNLRLPQTNSCFTSEKFLYRNEVKWIFARRPSPPLGDVNSGLQDLFLWNMHNPEKNSKCKHCFPLAPVCEFLSFSQGKSRRLTQHRCHNWTLGFWKKRLPGWVDGNIFGHPTPIKSGKTVFKKPTLNWAGFHAHWYSRFLSCSAALSIQRERNLSFCFDGNLGY